MHIAVSEGCCAYLQALQVRITGCIAMLSSIHTGIQCTLWYTLAVCRKHLPHALAMVPMGVVGLEL